MPSLYDTSSYYSTFFVTFFTTLSVIIAISLALPSITHAEHLLLTQRDGLPSNGTTALHMQNDTLWVGTTAGLGKWESGQAKTVELPFDEHHVLALHSYNEELWVGTADGIAQLQQEKWRTWQRGTDGLRSDWVTSFATYQERVAIGTYGGGIQEWTNNEWQSLGSDGPLQIKKLVADDQFLWAATPKEVWRWDNITWQQERLPIDVLSVKDLHVTESKIWVASNKGLFWKAHQTEKWNRTVLTTPITAITELADNRIIATTHKALVLLNETEEQLIPLNHYISTLLTTEQHVFIGTLGKGVIVVEQSINNKLDQALTTSLTSSNQSLLSNRPLSSVTAGSTTRESTQSQALPVVLLHGLGDESNLKDSTLRFLARWLQQDGHAVKLVPYDNQVSLLENTQAVRDTIMMLKEESGQNEVILLAHSLGGWVARVYLATGATDVAGLITLGTPHGGVRMAYERLVTQLADHETPNIRELLPEHVALLTPFIERADIPQLHIGGNLLPKGNLFMGFPAHDGIITAASATYAPGMTRIYPLLHGWSVATLKFGIPSFLWPNDLYRNTLRTWIQDLPNNTQSTRVSTLSLPEAGFTQRPLLAQTLAPEESVKINVTLDTEPTTWFLDGRGVSMDLVAPNGTFYAHDRFLLGNEVAHLPYHDAQQLFQPFDLWSTRNQPGIWQVNLTNNNPHAVSTRLSLVQPRQPTLSILLPKPWVEADEALTIEAQGEPNQTLVAILLDQSATLDEISPGRYQIAMRAPKKAGYHALRVVGKQVERWTVVGVYSDSWSVKEVKAVPEKDFVRLTLTVEGKGKLALGLQLLSEDKVVATRLIGPLERVQQGKHLIVEKIHNPTGSSDVRLEWRLFDAEGAFVPVQR